MVTASRTLIKLARKLAVRDEVLAMRRRGRLVPVLVKPSPK